jgi:CubicO group peptidase (beta-lactamase class C family)
VNIACSPTPVRAQEPTLAGHWQGAIETPVKPLAIDVDFAALKDGAWKGDISIPAQGTKDLPLAKIERKGEDVTFELPGIPGKPLFKGKLDARGKKLSGTFTQSGNAMPFHLDQGTDPFAAAKESLAGFDSFVSQAIAAWEVPGLAIAIVKNGEVILAQGFGLRDVAKKLPVTPRTLFAIGSCTKAFTTFVMGTLVDQGKLDWDKPVRTYIPELRLHDPVASELITPRDLVTHRSGLPRHDLIWYNASLSRKQIVDRLPYLEPTDTIRSKFQSNNIMFMTAGYLVERLTGQSWEDTVRERVFTPLAMMLSNFSVKDSERAADHALPYEERDDKVVEIPFRDINNAGPAGSINSCVLDMARWLVVQTHKGKIDAKQVISPAILADIQAPHMTTGVPQERKEIAPAGYGLGWDVDNYRGHRRVHHGGAIDGFIAATTLFPDDDLGMVVFANLGRTGLPEMVTRHASDRLLGLAPIDWSGDALTRRAKGMAATKDAKSKKETVRRPGTTPAHKLEEYAGEYEHPGYGIIKIELRESKLNFTYNNIEAPLEHWHFEVFRALKNPKDPEFEDQKVQFLTNVNGYVDGLSVAFEPSVKPIVFALRPDARLSDPLYLKRFTGEYELAGRTLGVRLKGSVLVLDSQGGVTVTLVPDRDDGFKVKEQSTNSLRFVSEKDQPASALALETPAGVFTAKRKAK